MKKFKLVGLSMLFSVGALAGCTKSDDPKPDPEHTHTFEEAWTSDANKHWHKATCGHDVKGSEAAHVDSDSDFKCDVCGFVMHTHSFDLSNWSSDASSHWHASTCGHDVKDSLGAHKDENGDFLCDVCGFVMHEHTFEAKWTTNESSHWHAATCEHTDLKSEEGNHVDKDGNEKCDVCGYDMHKHTFAEGWSSNESQHWHDATCGHDVKDSLGNHVDADKNFQCDICGKLLPEVVSIEINGPQDPVELGSVVDLSCAIVVGGGAESDVTWSLSNDNASLSRKSGESVQLLALKEGSVVVTVTSNFDASKSAELTIELIKSSKVAWTDAEKELMQEKLGIVLPFFPGSFAWGYDEASGMLVALSNVGSDVENVKTVLDALEYPKEEISGGIIYTLPGAEGFAVDVGVILTADGKAEVLAYAYRNAWPSDVVASYIGDWTDETVPAAAGENFEVSEQTSPYNALVIDIVGDVDAYISTLEGAEWQINDLTGTFGYYDCYSPKHYIELAIFPDDGVFEIQLMLVNPPVESWPAEAVASYIGDWTDEVVPAAEGTNFEVSEKTSPYNALVIDITGDASAYISKLEEAGWEIDDLTGTYGYYDCYSPKGYLELAVFADDGMFEIQLMLVNPPVTEWPAEAVASYIGDWTDEVVPAAEGTNFEVSEKTSPYNALVIDITGDASAYISKLEEAGWEIDDLTDTYGYYDCYSPKGYLELAVFADDGMFEIQLMLVNPPVPEWPAQAVAALLDGKTEVSIPEADGSSFVVAPLTGFYFGSITISGGDMDTYLETLRSAEFSVAWDSSNQCYVAAKGNLLMDIGENPDVEGEFQMLLYLKAAFPTADVAAAVEALVPGSETVIPEFEAKEYQLQDVRDYIGAFILYASGDSSLLNEYVGILDEAGWAVSLLEEGVYGAVSPAEDIMLQISYSDYYGELNVYIMTYTKPATEWPADDVAALVESIEADGTVPAADGLSYTCYEAQGYYPPQINVGVEEGTAETAAAAYIADLEDAGFFLVMSSYGYDYYAEEGKTLALCVYAYGDSQFIIELACLESPAVKPLKEWPADAVAAIVESIEAEGSAVPAFEGEGISFNVGSYYLTVNPGANDPEDLLADYCEKLEGLGYFVAGDNYGDPIYALEGETLGISPYYYNGSLCIELMKLSKPAAPAVFPTEAVEAFFDGKTDEVVPPMVAYDFEASDKTSYLEIKAYGGNVKDYMKVLSDAGWTADYDSSAYYNYAISPEGSIKMTLINYTSYVTLKLEYVPPKLTEWPADAIAEALGEKAKTTLPGITGEGLQFEFTDNGDDSMKLDVYGSTPSAYVSILEDAGFTVTEGSEEDQYWYLLSADKTVKVQVYDYMSAGQDYFRVKAYGQDPTWTGTSFDPAIVEEALGLSEGFIPAIADGTKFSFTQPSDDSFKVTVESGANYDNFIAALGEAGFVETSPNSGTFTKDNVVAVVTILNPLTQKYSVEYSVQNSPTPVGEWPIEDIAALLGDTRAAYLPEAVGATSVIVTGTDGDCTISITGVSAADYKQALLDNGFTFDGMSYSKEDLYVDVTGSGDSCTVKAYYFDF